MTHEEFKAKAQEVIDICNKYGFMKNMIMPYSFKMTVEELTKNWKDYDKYTSSSKAIMRDELKGFLPILDHWVKVENEPKVKAECLVGKLAGQIKEYPKSVAEELAEMNFLKIIKEVK